ncbi:nucleoside hydrolase [Coralloluteibacterium stylophorae]|uniref:Nucleoside hydrolase n=2 Tax=Coralloluteibacterium stylophorae TaxID=1776034 RepID=A0AAP2FZU7_9GAMM|nr:nucleoside hydrolase [Coralloluteibacterium stylophorae]MBS7458402.1 nucleoside hydrolase [Coralloluteibacterium stylophorae]
MPSPIPLLIDTDPGIDDALALLMAMDDPAHELVGLTVAAGNVGLAHTVRNALKVAEVAGVDVPVYAGCPVPLLHAAEDASYVHGSDGFGDAGLDAPAGRAGTEHAALAISRLAREHSGRLLLVTLGPLTNLALALRLDPELPRHVGRLVVMGGAVNGRGNTSVPSEFNLMFDPEAAHVVFEAFERFDLADWEATLAHALPHEALDAWLAADTPRARFYAAISRQSREGSKQRGRRDWASADPLAMAMALEPEGVLEAERHAVAMELTGAHTRGATVVDWLDRSGAPARARILLRYDRARFHERLRRALGA